MCGCTQDLALSKEEGVCIVCRYMILSLCFVMIARPDGTVKVRSVDHYSWHAGHRRSKRRRKEASVNGHCLLSEKITHDHVDDIVSGMAKLKRSFAIVCDSVFVIPFVFRSGSVG
jgi:hypothetical protein